ncbi:MAG TPA: cytidine deaminase [Pyrinomonadaceae bacterium]|nr:cytidine deaminase [Chloracidobacterium sp.]MBP9108113.1 cytidine deaminase [Pyrinomonadaceae bacterium]MBK7802069.1 cytidine deaminase [Chloracidobacterium sp.]MBK9437785.1 cytidine deaminase [Chloracidobacterium sp.]MBK9765803.1 cytidine deaminase [Chloracidobacterium sp.]
MDDKDLIASATAVRENAYAPFSEFRVGAAVETEDGEVIDGCNVESATYGLTICAERVAICKAVSQGKRKIKRIAVVADTEKLTPPCGSCRQIIWEFGGNIPVVMSNLQGKVETHQMIDLLPDAFDAEFLK